MLAGERHRERVITASEEAKYLAAGNDLLHDVSVVLFDTGMRPEECHRMKWEFVNWDAGRFGVVLIPDGKTESARRALPVSARVRASLEKRWKEAGEPVEGWIWPADTKEEHINHDSLKVQHKKALKASKVRAFEVYFDPPHVLNEIGRIGLRCLDTCSDRGPLEYQDVATLRSSLRRCCAQCRFSTGWAQN